jgi:hypothetical protein
VLNNDRKIFLIEEAAHDLQYAPGSSRMPVLVNARTANWDHGLIDWHTYAKPIDRGPCRA